MRNTLYYFAYGSNLHPLRLMERVPSAELVGVVKLPGWSLTFTKRGLDESGKCTIQKDAPQESVWGAVYAMRADERPLLDGAERGYHRRQLLFTLRGRRICCFTYLARAEHVEYLPPYTWYRDLVIAGARYHGFPEDFIDGIASAPAREDPDPVRQQRYARLLQAMGEG